MNPVQSAREDAERRAWEALERLVPDAEHRALYVDSVARYADAMALCKELRGEWDAAGRPLTELGSMRQPIPHPLVKMMESADTQAAKFAAAVGLEPPQAKRQVGRPRGAVSAPDRAAPPRLTRAGNAANLRAVPGGRAE